MMPVQQTDSGRGLPRTAALLGSAALCAIIGAVAYNIPAEVRAQRQEKLNRMTAEQRAVVKVQFERFKALPEAEQDRWRQFNAELMADRTGLKDELDQYIEWLGTVSLPERERIRQISDPVQRAVAVQEERRRQARHEQFGQAKLPRFGEEHLLSKADFEGAMAAIHRHLTQNRPNWGGEFAREFSRMELRNDPLNRAARILPALGQNLAKRKGKDRDEIAQEAIDVAQQALSDVAVKTELDKTEDPRKRRYQMYVLLIRTWGASVAEQIPDPNTDEGRNTLESHFNSADAKVQEWLLKSPPEFFWNGLRMSYASKHNIPLPSMGMMRIIHDANWEGDFPWQIHGNWIYNPPQGFGWRGGPGREGDRGRGGRGNEKPPPPERPDNNR